MHALDVLLGATIVVLSVTLWERPRIGAALACATLSAMWWPANNRVMEGPVLIVFSTDHGFTAADVLGAFGMLSAAWAIRRAPHPANRRWRAFGVIGGIALLGAMVALASG